MNRFFSSKTTETTDYYKRSYSRNKSSSHVVPSPTTNILEQKDNTHTVRIRLVFIRIGKKEKKIYFKIKINSRRN
jgi:hypothetical protein